MANDTGEILDDDTSGEIIDYAAAISASESPECQTWGWEGNEGLDHATTPGSKATGAVVKEARAVGARSQSGGQEGDDDNPGNAGDVDEDEGGGSDEEEDEEEEGGVNTGGTGDGGGDKVAQGEAMKEKEEGRARGHEQQVDSSKTERTEEARLLLATIGNDNSCEFKGQTCVVPH